MKFERHFGLSIQYTLVEGVLWFSCNFFFVFLHRYGYGSQEVKAVSATQCIFTCGRVAVVMDTKKQTQRFLRKHSKDITRYLGYHLIL